MSGTTEMEYLKTGVMSVVMQITYRSFVVKRKLVGWFY